MLIAADWVVPVSAPPIREGAVYVKGGHVAEVGRFSELVRRYPASQRFEYPGCTLVPGMVNAHTHLSLTALEGLIGSMDFPAWIGRLVRAMRGLDQDALAASAALGAQQCLRAGVTVVGDVAYGPESIAVAADAGLGGTFYWEVLGISPSSVAEVLIEREFPTDAAGECGLRNRCALSAHSVYTAGPDLIRELRRVARDAGVDFMMHAAESPAELELLVTGSGALASAAKRLAGRFTPPRVGTIRYLDRLDALDDAVLVHCVHLQSGEFDLLRKAKGVVLCPRSNAFLHNGRASVSRLLRSGVPVAVGTDSSASNENLDIRAEARALRRIAPELTGRLLLRMLTLEGAKVLGLGGLFGELSAGAQADLVVMNVTSKSDPEESLIDAEGVEVIRSVMSGGVWRVLDGRAAFEDAKLLETIARATRDARAALGM